MAKAKGKIKAAKEARRNSIRNRPTVLGHGSNKRCSREVISLQRA